MNKNTIKSFLLGGVGALGIAGLITAGLSILLFFFEFFSNLWGPINGFLIVVAIILFCLGGAIAVHD